MGKRLGWAADFGKTNSQRWGNDQKHASVLKIDFVDYR
jgi:hypothetical protein